MSKKVAVVGAGIVGLATAAEAIRAGAEVRLYEAGTVAGARSQGLTRIFRLAHGDPRLVALAARARAGWRVWEERFGRRLIGGEGLIVSGEQIVPEWDTAMTAAGAPHRLLAAAEARELLPIAHLPAVPLLFDPTGGATRVRRTVELLQAEIGTSLHLTAVHGVETAGGGPMVRSAAGDWACDEVVLTAGADTLALARPLGLEVPMTSWPHSRFTFALREPNRQRQQSCWIDESGAVGNGLHAYAQPVGSTGRYALGVDWAEGPSMPDDADAVSRESLQVAQEYVRLALPGLEPEPVAEIRCTSFDSPFLDRNGDGFVALRRDGITAFYGNNLFKFAPLLGELLARCALDNAVPDELALRTAVR